LTPDHLERDPRFSAIGFEAGEILYEARGCERCGHVGYRGRQGVFEILEMTDDIRKLVGPITDSYTVDEAAIQRGMTTMLADAVAKCRAGVTTFSEVFRVTTLR
jgi:general secretion pathway protein E